jgi:mannose-6-phosphate isomerase-like protein (cupin superfamily)
VSPPVLARTTGGLTQRRSPLQEASMHDRLTPATALATLHSVASRTFVELFRHGSLVVEIYKPVKVDLQMPHTRDEVYVVLSGTGVFLNNGVRQPFGPGEVLFVPANVEHRFEQFSNDFATWVFFYGPEGGENAM